VSLIPPMIVLAGPTGVGKTELSLSLAAAIGGEVVSVDSRQVYRRLDIGTAKPSASQRQQVRHHLLDLIDPADSFDAGRFGAAATAALQDIAARGRTAVLVGGSGLYLSSLIDGLFDESADDRIVSRRTWASRLQAEGLAVLWSELGQRDPAAQASLSPTDGVRILRALELSAGGTRAARWANDRRAGIGVCGPMVCLHRPRSSLYQRIDERVSSMLRNGWLEEVEALLGGEWQVDAPGLCTLGYNELISHIQADVGLEQTLASIRQKTRQYAKRQMTWFRRDRRFRWLDLDHLSNDAARHRILRQFEAFQRTF
jgi:tRNA dimethylallyltransferase